MRYLERRERKGREDKRKRKKEEIIEVFREEERGREEERERERDMLVTFRHNIMWSVHYIRRDSIARLVYSV